MNIYEALRASHKTQRELADALIETKGASDERTQLFTQLKHELEAHAVGEERYFYVPLMMHDMTMPHARHGIAEHHTLDDLIETLETTELNAPSWLINARKLRDEVYHHLEEEEKTIFQISGKVLTDEQKTNLAGEYQAEYERFMAKLV